MCCFLNIVLLNLFNSLFQLDQTATAQLVEDYDLYYDMTYTMAYSTFAKAANGNCFCDPRICSVMQIIVDLFNALNIC
jgi:hypothetical protein